jgi:methionyl-tRNA formyltransferase
MMRIAFLGSDAIALPLLEWLGRGGGPGEVVGVFTQPDRPAGRGQKVQPNAVKAWALARGLPVFQPEKLGEGERAQLAGLGADLGLVMAYGHILREDFIGTPRLGTLNLHVSLLPKYRGASPIQAAIASGETATGVSLMRIVRRLDAGPVADVEAVPIAPLDTAAEVEAKLAAACGPLLARALPRLARGELTFVEQDAAQATYCRKLEKADGALDFAAPAAVLAARINGLSPWPGCAVELDGQPLRLGLAEALPSATAAPGGTVLGTDGSGLLVASGGTTLRLLRLQRPGGRLLAAGEFLRGRPIPAGTRLPSQPMTPLVEKR